MDLSTNYLGFKLPHPLIPGASPLTGNLDTARKLEDAGAPLLILNSLFEEQIQSEQYREVQDVEAAEESYAEALTYHPRRDEFKIGPELYLEQVRRIKTEMERWMEAREYGSLQQMRGSMCLDRSPDPLSFVRANYMCILRGGVKYV